MELIGTGKVLDMQETKSGEWVRVIVQGRGRYNEVVMLTADQAVTFGVTVGATVRLPMRASVEKDRQGRPSGGLVFFGVDAPVEQKKAG